MPKTYRKINILLLRIIVTILDIISLEKFFNN